MTPNVNFRTLNGVTYSLRKAKNTMSLYQVVKPEGAKRDVFQLVGTKTISGNGKITRRQYNPQTGQEIGMSEVYPPTRYRSGSILVNDRSLKMKAPFHFFEGKISSGELLRQKGLEINTLEEMTPIAQRFMKMLVATMSK